MVDAILSFWEWILGIVAAIGLGGGAFAILRKKLFDKASNPSIENLAVVRTVAGPAAKEVGLILEDQLKSWRLNNLINISERITRISNEKGLTRENLRALNKSIGLQMLEKASYEEDTELQEMWANLMITAASGNDDDDPADFYKTLSHILADMSKWDCQLLSVVVEEGIDSQDAEGQFVASPLTLDCLVQNGNMPSAGRVYVHIERLISLGLVTKEIKAPLEAGGPLGLQHAYIPSMLGLNLYLCCGNNPRWYESQ